MALSLSSHRGARRGISIAVAVSVLVLVALLLARIALTGPLDPAEVLDTLGRNAEYSQDGTVFVCRPGRTRVVAWRTPFSQSLVFLVRFNRRLFFWKKIISDKVAPCR